MSEIKPFCIFCLKKQEKLNLFAQEILSKCVAVLKIRQKNNLCGKDVKLPKELNNFQQYHSQCYRRFAALPKKHRYSQFFSTSTEPSTSTATK